MPQRIRAGCDPAFYMQRLQARAFATAHSCGLRLLFTSKSYISVDFATAHSCGLRPRHPLGAVCSDTFATAHSCGLRPAARPMCPKPPSLPQRIRAGCDCLELHVRRMDDLCHSAFVRVATKHATIKMRILFLCHSAFVRVATLIQATRDKLVSLCHSAFVRVATKNTKVATPQNDLCHSAFVRVATYTVQIKKYMSVFATAHSCGLRRRQQTSPNPTLRFATAHSCGLRLYYQ